MWSQLEGKLSINKNSTFHRAKNKETCQAKTFENYTSIIGILLIAAIIVVPLCLISLYSITAQAPQTLELEPQQFNLDATYAYVGPCTDNANVTDDIGNQLAPSQYPSVVYFNLTRSNVENVECDAIIEVFNVKIDSDKGPAENFAFFVGTNYVSSFSPDKLDTLTECIYNLINLSTVDSVTGNFRFNWPSDEAILSVKVGSFGTYTNYMNGGDLWNAGKPNSVSVIFHRIGYVTMTDGATSVQPDTTSANNKTQVQLQEFGDGFLRNELVPTAELLQMNLFYPFN